MQFGLKKPVVIRYPRGGEGKIKFDIHRPIEENAEVIKTGKDLSIIAIGKMVERAVEVANILEKQGKTVDVINARFLKPLDEDKIITSIRKTKKVITIEDNIVIGGLGNTVEALISRQGYNDISLKKFGYPDEFVRHGSVAEIEKKYGLDAESIAKAIKNSNKSI